MTEYLIPTGPGEAEFEEKRSRFLGHVLPVDSESEARAHIETMKKRYHDARHNCWCYLIRNGAVRYSDDGEPQGTAGQPMLEVFQREGVTNVCCVVTRYFGGILLGAGGLLRAYTRSAKDALDAAGISVVRRWVEVSVTCPYSLFERIKLEVESFSGLLEEPVFSSDVTIRALLSEGQVDDFSRRITELSAGSCSVAAIGEAFRGAPRSKTDFR
ncbi:MAG: YigZ family protein [Oscillospiraceae bacterium]|nr:YigZ family protein [Oscillospiraceae bacterium]